MHFKDSNFCNGFKEGCSEESAGNTKDTQLCKREGYNFRMYFFHSTLILSLTLFYNAIPRLSIKFSFLAPKIKKCYDKLADEKESKVVECNPNCVTDCSTQCLTVGYKEKIIQGCGKGSTSQSEDKLAEDLLKLLPKHLLDVLGAAMQKSSDNVCVTHTVKQNDGKDEHKAFLCTCNTEECNKGSFPNICSAGSLLESSIKNNLMMSALAGIPVLLFLTGILL